MKAGHWVSSLIGIEEHLVEPLRNGNMCFLFPHLMLMEAAEDVL